MNIVRPFKKWSKPYGPTQVNSPAPQQITQSIVIKQIVGSRTNSTNWLVWLVWLVWLAHELHLSKIVSFLPSNVFGIFSKGGEDGAMTGLSIIAQRLRDKFRVKETHFQTHPLRCQTPIILSSKVKARKKRQHRFLRCWQTALSTSRYVVCIIAQKED